jgi:hypothetical protein
MINKIKLFVYGLFKNKLAPKKKLSYCDEYPWAPSCRIYED